MNTKKHEKLLYKDLSYQIQGAAIEVRKNFGPGLKETIYQNAFAEELKARNVKFDKEKSIQIFSPKTGKLIGSYRPDFIVEDKILIELKAVEKIPKMFLDQIYSYLKNSKYELGYFINFASPKLYIKRVILTNDRKPFIANLLVSISLLFVLFGVFASLTQAAQMFFDAKTTRAQIGEKFEVNLFVNVEQESVNAFESKIIFPRDILDLEKIQDGNSIVNFWIERPKENTTGQIRFSGITPGGYLGQKGFILGLVFQAKAVGNGIIEIRDQNVLRNDGQGTAVPVQTSPFRFVVSRTSSSVPLIVNQEKDADAPEAFTLEITRDPHLFENRWFVVFATQDKGSGIDYYEIQERKDNSMQDFLWKRAESPYVLKDQGLARFIFVRAVDKAGNERIATRAPQSSLSYASYLVGSILGIVAVSYLLMRILWKKQKRKK